MVMKPKGEARQRREWRGENVTPEGGRHEKVGCVLGSSPERGEPPPEREEVRSPRDPGLLMWISIWDRTGEIVLSISSTGKLLYRGC